MATQLKSLYDSEKQGFEYNADGFRADKEIEECIKGFYTKYLDEGFSPSELREIMLSKIFEVSVFENALRASKG